MRNPGSLVLDIAEIHRIWGNLGFRICIRPCSFRFLALYPQPPLHIHRSQRNLSESILAFQTVRPRMRSFGSVLAVFFAVLVISTASSAVVADDTEDYETLSGYVFSIIKGNDTYLEGAKITATDADGNIYRTETNNKGYFIMSCPPVDYTLTVECGGFDDVEIPVKTGNADVYIPLSLRDTTVIWGLDIPHVLEIIGLIIVFGLLALGAVMIRFLRKSSKIKLINDADDPMAGLEDLEELEEEYDGEEYVYDDEIKES